MTKANLSTEDMKKLGKLAKLSLSEEEIEVFKPQLASIIDYISKLNELNTDDVEPANQVTGLVNVLRDDETQDERCLTQNDATMNKKEIHMNMFEVDAVLQDNA